MNTTTYSRFITDNTGIFEKLSGKQIFFVTDLVSGGLIQNETLADYNCGCFIEADLEIIGKLINSDFFNRYNHQVVIDTPKAVSLYKKSDNADTREENVLLL